jgi:hypothetical protein
VKIDEANEILDNEITTLIEIEVLSEEGPF